MYQVVRRLFFIKIFLTSCVFMSLADIIIIPTSYSAKDFQGVPLDQILINFLNYKNGIFLEVGGHDGVFQSNTKLLEDLYDWQGILIEPSESAFNLLAMNRKHSNCFQCAIGSFEEHGTWAYGDFDGHPMASLTGRINRPANYKVLIRSLQSILDECGIDHINFFSLDIEGYEFNALKGIDFTKTTFDYLLIEIYKDQFDEITNFLNAKGYEMLGCISNYNTTSNQNWDGTHNDYLFIRNELKSRSLYNIDKKNILKSLKKEYKKLVSLTLK